MSILRINADHNGLTLHDSGAPLAPALIAALAGSGPVVIMVHGFKFEPGHPEHCPHTHILSDLADNDDPRALSWPRALGMTGAEGPLGIAFGWPSRGSIWQAYGQAEIAGRALAALIGRIRRLAPHRPVRTIAHSLGGRVVLAALPHLRPGDVERIVLLSPAELIHIAEGRLATAAGRAAEVLSVSSGENHLFDRLLEAAFGHHWARAMTRARQPLPGTLDLQLNDPAALTALARLGFSVAPPDRRVCHWFSYLRPGVFDLYRALLGAPDGLTLTDLQAALQGAAATPARPARAWPLFAAGNAP
ncbi:alpha/beta hydrolase [Pseudooceanicola sp. LIPI14-2-Ac024]|uniref:alpha/beta hydrolase n=1 Tax=Pseudooceanicola sp. LIPI14-2-Ac024 TaxID=3344875 RepID=UPI0035D077AC